MWPMNPVVAALIFSSLISLVSLVGILFFKIKKFRAEELLILVGVATGALLGDAFLHLIPEAAEGKSLEEIGTGVIVGILIFFILEKILRWRHCHEIECQDKRSVAGISLMADGVHNFIDGLIIGGSFLTSWKLGIATSMAVLMHEIPQEIGDLAVLVHSGMPLKKAALMNLLSALLSIMGVIIVAIGGQEIFGGQLVAITAGGFIYLAASDLIPELHRHESKIKTSLGQLISVLVGVGIMYFLV